MRRVAVALVIVVIAAVAFTMWRREETRKADLASREAALKQTVAELRRSIETFRRENGRYPRNLGELGRVPVDPMTGKADWRVETEEMVRPSDDFTATSSGAREVFVINVRSSAPGYAEY